MIYIDVDGVCVDFVGTAKRKFGVPLEHNVFDVWCWLDSEECKTCSDYAKNNPDAFWADEEACFGGRCTPEEFYRVAEPQPWFAKLSDSLRDCNIKAITVDYAAVKSDFLNRSQRAADFVAIEAPDKTVYCSCPCDLLIDDSLEECERWRKKGGIAYWFNLAEQDPFGKFIKWWRL